MNINTDPSAPGHPALHEVAMVADATLAPADLLEALGPQPQLAVEPGWLAVMRGVRARYDAALAAMVRDSEETMHPAALAQAIAAALPRRQHHRRRFLRLHAQ